MAPVEQSNNLSWEERKARLERGDEKDIFAGKRGGELNRFPS